MSYSFQNKVAWVTGASSGIGKALCFELNKRGCKVILSARREDELKNILAQLPHADKAKVLPIDLSQSANLKQKCAEAIACFGHIDLLFNNGGVSQRGTAFETSEEVDRQLMEVNFFSNIALSKNLLPHFRERKQGYIIVTSSIAGKFGFYFRSAYSAAKHALHGFYESLRLEEEENGLKVLIACPGKVATDMSVNALKADGSKNNKTEKQMATGISPEACAQQMLKGIEQNKEEILIGGREIKAVTVKRFFPKLFGRIIRKQTRE